MEVIHHRQMEKFYKPGRIKNVDGKQAVVVLRHDNLHIVVQRLHIPGIGVVERPEVLLEVEVGEEDAHPDPEVELGVGPAARVQHGAAHPGH